LVLKGFKAPYLLNPYNLILAKFTTILFVKNIPSMAHKSLTKAIARELELGNTCYVNRQSRKITTIVDLEAGMDSPEERDAQLEKLEANIKKYYKVPRMSADEEIHVMKDFAEEDINTSIRKELTNALKRKSPIRNFMQIIENQEDLYQYWLIFKAKWYQEWVRGYLLDVYRY